MSKWHGGKGSKQELTEKDMKKTTKEFSGKNRNNKRNESKDDK